MAKSYDVSIGIDAREAKRGAQDVRASLAGIKAEAREGASAMRAAGGVWVAALAAIAGGVAMASKAVRALADTAQQMEPLTRSLTLLGGNAAAAGRELEYIRGEARRLGLETISAGEAYAKFALSLRGTALEGDSAREVFSGVQTAATALGLSAGETANILDQLQQMTQRGTVSAESLAGQLGKRLPGALGLAAQAMGVSTEELRAMAKEGKLLASDLLPKLAETLESTYGAAAAQAADGLGGSLTRVGNAWTDLKVAVLESGLDKAMEATVRGAALLLEWLVGVVRKAAQAIRGLLVDYLQYQAEATLGLYRALEKLPDALPGVQKLRNNVLDLGGTILDLRDWLSGTTGEALAAAPALGQVEEAATGLGDSARTAAQELERLIAGLYARLEASDPRRIVREGLEALQVLERIEAAGLRGTEVWRIAAEAVVAYAEALAQATQPIPTPEWTPDINPREFEEHITAQVLFDVDAVSAAFAKLEQDAARAADRLRGEWGGVWDWYEKRVAQITYLQRNGALEASEAAGYIRQAWVVAVGGMASALADAFDYIEQVAGGTFGRIAGYLANLARGVQGATQFGASVSQAATGMKLSAGTAGAMGSVATMAGVYMAIYQLGKQIVADQKARRYSDGGQVGVTLGHVDWFGGSTKYGGQFAEQMKDLIKSIEDTLGGSFEQLAKLSIKVRNDGKDVQAFVDGVMIGKFKSVDEAIKAAFTRALRTSALSGVDDLVAQGVAQLRYSSLDEALSKLGALREIAQLDFGSGLTSLLESVRGLEKLWAVLAELREATPAVVAGFERLAAAEARAWQEARDAITGRERTAEEERAYREQQAQIFNAELALRKAELELRRWELAQELDLLRARVEIARGRGELGLSEERIRRGELVRQGEVLGAELSMRSDYLQALGALAQGEAKIRQATLEVGKTAVEAQIELLEAQLAALDQLLAALPTSIDLGEIRIPNLGGVDVSAGGGGDPLGDFLREVATLSRSLLPPAARQLAELNLQFEELVARALELGVSTEELDRIYGEMLAALQAETRKPWQEILAGNGPQADFDRIIQAMIAGLQDYFDLGLDGTEVMQAAAVQLAALRDSILSSLSPTYAMQMQIDALAEQIDFLRTNMEALGLSAADLDAILGELQLSNYLSLAERMAGYLDDQGLLMELEQLRWELERANLRMQMDLLLEAGALSEEQYERLVRIWDRLPDVAPAGFGSGRGGRGSSSENKVFSDAVDRFRRATEQLIAFQQDLLLGPQSALSPEERFLEAQRRYQDVYQRALAGDLDAREQFAQVARDYLDAARDFFSSSESYALIFEQIRRALEVLIGMSPPSGGFGGGNAGSGGGSGGGAYPVIPWSPPRGSVVIPGGDPWPWYTPSPFPPGIGTPPAPPTPPGIDPSTGKLADEIRNSGQSQARGTELLRRELETMRESQAEQLDEIRRLNTTLTRREAQAPRRSSAA